MHLSAVLSQVLVAAREPLWVGQLQALGVYDGRTTLPGWGLLFFERHSKVSESCCAGGQLQLRQQLI